MTTQKLSLWANSTEDLQTLKSAVSEVFGNHAGNFSEDSELVFRVSGDDHERMAGYTKPTSNDTQNIRSISHVTVDVESRSELRAKMNAVIAALPANNQSKSVAHGNGISMGKETYEVIEGGSDTSHSGGPSRAYKPLAAEASL